MKPEGTASPSPARRKPIYIRSLAFVLGWAALFTLAYAPAPLYTSNQNQYFLHGLARAGLASLNQDWLANTLDPTPLFSKLIEITWQLLPWQPIFYLYYGALAGIYFFSVFGIANRLFGANQTPARRAVTLAVLLVLHSAALRYLISRLLGVEWDYLLDGGVAGQRLLGNVLQPSLFGVFLVLSIFSFLRARRGWAILCLLIAASFHPTYLLSAALLTAVYMGITFWETKDPHLVLALGVVALLGVSPIVWHTYATFGASSPELAAQARQMLVDFRIPHHAIPSAWFDVTALVKLAFVLLALLWLRPRQAAMPPPFSLPDRTKLFHILLWPALAALLLTLAQILSQSSLLALLFPWRVSTWLVPLSVSLLAAWGIDQVWGRWPAQAGRYARVGTVISLGMALIFAAAGLSKSWINWQTKLDGVERPTLAFVAAHQQPDQVYLIPTKMQDFRLEAGAPAFVDFKSIPYEDVDVLEWYRRLRLADQFYTRGGCGQLTQLAVEGITHLVLPQAHPARACPAVVEQFRDENYGVYALQQP